MVSTYDIREHRHGPRTNPDATWHRTPSKYATLHTSMEEAAFIADALHKPTLTTYLTDSGEVVETIYNIDTTGYAQPKVSTLKRADNRVTPVPGALLKAGTTGWHLSWYLRKPRGPAVSIIPHPRGWSGEGN